MFNILDLTANTQKYILKYSLFYRVKFSFILICPGEVRVTFQIKKHKILSPK